MGSPSEQEYEFVADMPTEDLGRQVAAFFATERTFGDDPGVGHGFDGGWNVFAASFAAEGVVAEAGGGRVKHGTSIGE
ncbi:MAG TPA: hypothetical protein VHZ28_04155 [Terracidiphilus sp.]|jgi:hypothetical protein|nr:hypothetical protein [Terracidiphilus sp.]